LELGVIPGIAVRVRPGIGDILVHLCLETLGAKVVALFLLILKERVAARASKRLTHVATVTL
jgi:hypothetical protein